MIIMKPETGAKLLFGLLGAALAASIAIAVHDARQARLSLQYELPRAERPAYTVELPEYRAIGADYRIG